ncbi:putative acetyl-CoA synthetase [Ramicandelaber brevisporus]|nr:putative acetyl-CoA synthetase [Ramicandelaber brevisporus]
MVSDATSNGSAAAAAAAATTPQVFAVPERLLQDSSVPKPHVSSVEEYRALHARSIEDPDGFFGDLAKELITWSTPFTTVRSGSLTEGDVAWFQDGQLNVSYNCLDRHALANPDKVAIIHEADEPSNSRNVTFSELLRETSRLANAMQSLGIRKGDVVAIYMPMVPEAAAAMLACARIGAVHTVVFAGFSADSLAERMNDAKCKLLITADEGLRGSKIINLKKIADQAVAASPVVQNVIVFRHTGNPVPFNEKVDIWWQDIVAAQRPYCPPVPMSPEDPLFILYTSGSTGKPKGLIHTSGGYLLGAIATVKYVFDVHPETDRFGCSADVGWITGHSYIVYGPLGLGVPTLMFESLPTYPDASRYWTTVDKHQLTHFYTAPTAIRALRRLGDKWVEKSDLSSLRVIGSVGEPINPEAWLWYHDVVGRKRCAVVDTYWQTETGSIVITPLPGAISTKPGSATVPFFGIDARILDPHTGEELTGNDVTGVLAIKSPWPSMARTVSGDHKRYLDTYMRPYAGHYFTGDGASRDADGYYWIRGRVDDVINVSGHRLSTAEIESALILHPSVAEAAVVGAPDEITGQTICAFVTIKHGVDSSDEKATKAQLVSQVRTAIGPFAAPKHLILVDELPKTRSGKIIRRILRKVVAGEADQLGDLSTLSDPNIIDVLIQKTKASF